MITEGNYELDDNELAVKAKQGDKQAFEVLVGRFSPRLRAFLCKRVANRSDVEDIIQDTFLKAYLNIASYDPSYKFACWLFTIASRTAINNARRQRSYQIEFEQQIASQVCSPEQAAIDSEQQENLWALARELENRQYTALYLKYAEDFSIEEIAETMKVTKLNARVILHRARNSLIKKAKFLR